MIVPFLAIFLGGCPTQDSTVVAPELPELPDELVECFKDHVKIPKSKRITQQQLAELVYKLRRSEVIKGECGRQTIAWYNGIKDGLQQKRVR